MRKGRWGKRKPGRAGRESWTQGRILGEVKSPKKGVWGRRAVNLTKSWEKATGGGMALRGNVFMGRVVRGQ